MGALGRDHHTGNCIPTNPSVMSVGQYLMLLGIPEEDERLMGTTRWPDTDAHKHAEGQ